MGPTPVVDFDLLTLLCEKGYSLQNEEKIASIFAQSLSEQKERSFFFRGFFVDLIIRPNFLAKFELLKKLFPGQAFWTLFTLRTEKFIRALMKLLADRVTFRMVRYVEAIESLKTLLSHAGSAWQESHEKIITDSLKRRETVKA